MKTVHGIIQGKVIQLATDIGLDDGQEVEVTVCVVSAGRRRGDGIVHSAGAMAAYWTAEDDQILLEIQRNRKRPRGGEIPE
jgi:hypothetical protein